MGFAALNPSYKLLRDRTIIPRWRIDRSGATASAAAMMAWASMS
jgi:hypothetical protein